LSHVWSEGLGSDDHNRGLHLSLADQIFEKVASLGVRWIWTDSLAIPGGKRALTVVEELKANLINAMANIYRTANQVVIVDALCLRLESTDPVKAAAVLCCGRKAIKPLFVAQELVSWMLATQPFKYTRTDMDCCVQSG